MLSPPPGARALGALAVIAALALPGLAQAAPNPVGKLKQLADGKGCVTDRAKPAPHCTKVRALGGPGPFLGSNALALSPDGKNLYVAASKSNAITVLKVTKGKLSQAPGAAGCVAAGGQGGCASAVGLEHPNSVAVSADGASVYATADGSDAVTAFARAPDTGALTQLTDGCISNASVSGCTTGRALDGADVVTVSPDGNNVYVGAFFGNAVAAFTRDPATGALTQPADESGCITDAPTTGCATGLALAAPEGMAISPDGNTVYAATAVSNAVVVLARDPSTGALSQATDGSGCVTNAPLTGCATGIWLAGANAVTVSPDDANVYVTSLLSNSLTSFSRSTSTGALTQLSGTSACVIYLLAVGCSLGREFEAPEGLAVSPDGASVYAGAFNSNALGVLNRDATTGGLIQKSKRAGCLVSGKAPDCTRARALGQPSSVAVSASGKFVYATAFASNAVGVFKRATK